MRAALGIKITMKTINYILLLILLLGLLWLFIGNHFIDSLNITSRHSQGYHIELDIPKSEVINSIKNNEYYVNSYKELSKYCIYKEYEYFYSKSNVEYLYFVYAVGGIEYLHVSFVTSTWDGKTLLVYEYYYINYECDFEFVKGNKKFISKFRKNVIEYL